MKMRVFNISAVFVFFYFFFLSLPSVGDRRVYALEAQRDILFIGVFPYIVIMDGDSERLASRSQLTFLVFMMKPSAANALQLCRGLRLVPGTQRAK